MVAYKRTSGIEENHAVKLVLPVRELVDREDSSLPYQKIIITLVGFVRSGLSVELFLLLSMTTFFERCA